MMISILGLYRQRPDLFEEFTLEDLPGVSRETVINTILTETAELEALYPDADFMKWALGVFSKKRHSSWNRWATALSADYDPTADTDLGEDRTEKIIKESARESTGTATGNATGENIEKTVPYGYAEGVTSGVINNSSIATTNTSGSMTDTEHDTHTVNAGRSGRSGRYSPQDLIQQELRLYEYDIHGMIAKDVAERFTLGVWT